MRWRVRAPLMLFAAALTGCSSPGAGLSPLPPLQTGAYQLGPGDTVRIITYGADQLTGKFIVGDAGDVALPLLGTVHAAGLTARELQKKITEDLVHTGMFRQPSVVVEVVRYRPVFILGEVKKPGEYPYQSGMTVLTAVAIAGGFTYRALETRFSIVRNSDGTSVEGRAERDTRLKPGDVITVFERRF
ncbi:MAG: polysaccharide biosynthesis/export family protein [Gammaproteobacteria bacterium]